MKKSEKSVRVNLYLPEDLVEWLKKKAKAENRKLNNYMTTLLQKLKAHEG